MLISLSLTFCGICIKSLGFAFNTPSTLPGWAIAGEEGPELVKLRGGEQIYIADETEQTLAQNADPLSVMATGSAASNSYHIDIHNQYDINGSTNVNKLRSIIEKNNRNLPGMIEDALNDIETDRAMRAYT